MHFNHASSSLFHVRWSARESVGILWEADKQEANILCQEELTFILELVATKS
jgi:hypothetical protein